jgi:superfamily I DNA/RNA helicase
MCQALKGEIAAAKSDPSRSFNVNNGTKVHSDERGHLYSFKAEIATPIPPETPVRLVLDSSDIRKGVLVAIKDFDILIKLAQDSGEKINRAKITSDPWFIFDILKKRLEEKLDQQYDGNNLPGILLGLHSTTKKTTKNGYKKGIAALESLGDENLQPNSDQRAVLRACLSNNLRFIWGPPGTGKTSSLAQVVRAYFENNERVLVLAHANAAVDVAMDRISRVFSGAAALEEGQVVRIGAAQLPEVLENNYILPEKILEEQQPELVAEKLELEDRLNSLIKSIGKARNRERRKALAEDIEKIREQLAAVNESFRSAMSAIVKDASVIGATFSRFIIDEQVWSWEPDVSIIDEASMAPFPSVLAAALQSRNRQMIFGDFRQLPPICLSESTSAKLWLSRDTFDIAGVRSKIDSGEQDRRVEMLGIQYRMAQPICDVVSRLAYNGKLKTAPVVPARVQSVIGQEPWAGHSLVLIDTSGLSPICFREPKAGSFSRINLLHAAISATYADAALKAELNDIGIISPYKAQSRIASILNYKSCERGEVTAATVHRFQGSERDVVFLDLVDAPFEKGASNLTGRDYDTALRLVNVGASRPKGKLVVVADVEFITERHDYKSPSRMLMNLIQERGHVTKLTPAKLEGVGASLSFKWFGKWADIRAAIASDVKKVDGPVYMNLQNQFPVTKGMVTALQGNIEKGFETIVFTLISNVGALEDTRVDLRLTNPPGGFLALIGSEIVYLGSCYPESCFVRLEDRRTSELLAQMVLGTYISTAPPSADIEKALGEICGRCPDCGENRRPVKNANGHLVLRCKNIEHSSQKLDVRQAEKIVETMKIRCKTCRSPAAVKATGNYFQIECTCKNNGCTGTPPDFDQLFGGQ